MTVAGKIRIAEHIEVTWLDSLAAAACPNCGAAGPARQLLEIDYHPPGKAHRFILQECGHCTARFVDNPEVMDYATEELIEIGWHVYQIQLGAGVWPITAPLTRLDKPAGARLLEIGGAYGFGLDFCLRARGWTGEGFDPSPLAEFGARQLGLDIRQDYFEAKDLARGPYDVVMATEVVEHLPRPPEFLALMRRAVAEDGILVLTTPDAAWITPALPAAQLMPLLSPGAHVVLQTQESLTQALRAAGFHEVVVVRGGLSLVAYASARPFRLNEDAAAARALYRTYLVERGRLAAPGSDLCFGFAGRGLFEAMNDGDFAAAEAAWQILRQAAQPRFGLDLDSMTALPDRAMVMDLPELGQAMPLGLGMILYGRAMQMLGNDLPRHEVLPKLLLARAAIEALQGSLGRRSLIDGLSASLLPHIEAEVALCRAEAGEAAVVPALVRAAAERQSLTVPWQGLVGLVNAGAFATAAELQAALDLRWPAEAMPADLRADVLRSLANLALAPGHDPLPAVPAAQALRRMGVAGADALLLETFTRLVNAGRYEEAGTLAEAHDAEALMRQVGGKCAEDAETAAIMLALSRGETAASVRRLKALQAATGGNAVLDALYVDGFVRLMNEKDFAEAKALAAGDAVSQRLHTCKPQLRRDALLALLLLALAPGGAVAQIPQIPQLLRALAEDGLEAERLTELVFAGFIALVNADLISEATQLLPRLTPALQALQPPFDPVARDVLFTYGMLGLKVASETAPAAAALARLRADLVAHMRPEAPEDLLWQALRGEMVALNQLQRHDEAAALARDFVPLARALPPAAMEEDGLRGLVFAAFITLVNADMTAEAAGLLPLLTPAIAKLRPPYDPVARNVLFTYGMLGLKVEAETPRAAITLARLRDDLVKRMQPDAPDPLFWSTLRGEMVALHQLRRGDEANALARDFVPRYPNPPDDLKAALPPELAL